MKTRHHTHPVWLRELLRHPLKPAALTVSRPWSVVEFVLNFEFEIWNLLVIWNLEFGIWNFR